MTQVVDIISWLRRLSDEDNRHAEFSDFKRRFPPLANRLDSNMKYENIDRLRWKQISP